MIVLEKMDGWMDGWTDRKGGRKKNEGARGKMMDG